MASAVALVVGGATAWVQGPVFRSRAIFQVAVEKADSLQDIKRELAHFLITSGAGGSGMVSAADRSGVARWSLHSVSDRRIALDLFARGREEALQQARRLGEAFIQHMKAVAVQRQSTPGEVEDVLGDQIHRLEQRLREVKASVDEYLAQLPLAPDAEQQDPLSERWRIARGDLQTLRAQLAKANAALVELKKGPSGTALVTAEDRRAAIEADLQLTQDLAELGVNLVEMKRHLLVAAHQCAEGIAALLSACEQLAAAPVRVDDPQLEASTRERLSKVLSEAAELKATIATFADAWTSRLAQFESADTSPQSSPLLDDHARARKQMSDFLYGVGQRLGGMRGIVDALGDSGVDDARHHVLQSQITRAHQLLQSEFHRLEFTAEQLEGASNFRLDAALRAARGLRRRTHERLLGIEQKLAAQALERARREHEARIAAYQAQIDRLEAASEQTLDELLAVQERMNTAHAQTESQIRARMQAEVMLADVRSLQARLSEAEAELSRLAEQRATTDFTGGLTLVGVQVEGRPSNLSELLWTSGLMGLCGFLSTLGGQMLRRS